ncbi:MAG: hypothetical protein ABSG65_28120 [Bryobacteraceae bacterium]
MPGADTKPAVIAAHVRDMPYFQLRDSQSACVFRPVKQGPGFWARLVVRCTGKPRSLARDIRILFHTLAPRSPVDRIETLASSRDATIARERMLTLLSALLGILVLVLAAAGAYGITRIRSQDERAKSASECRSAGSPST